MIGRTGSEPLMGMMKRTVSYYYMVWPLSRRLKDCELDFILIWLVSLSQGEHSRDFYWVKELGVDGIEIVGIT